MHLCTCRHKHGDENLMQAFKFKIIWLCSYGTQERHSLFLFFFSQTLQTPELWRDFFFQMKTVFTTLTWLLKHTLEKEIKCISKPVSSLLVLLLIWKYKFYQLKETHAAEDHQTLAFVGKSCRHSKLALGIIQRDLCVAFLGVLFYFFQVDRFNSLLHSH